VLTAALVSYHSPPRGPKTGGAGARGRPGPNEVWSGGGMATGPKQILDYDDYAAIPPKRWELWM